MMGTFATDWAQVTVDGLRAAAAGATGDAAVKEKVAQCWKQ